MSRLLNPLGVLAAAAISAAIPPQRSHGTDSVRRAAWRMLRHQPEEEL